MGTVAGRIDQDQCVGAAIGAAPAPMQSEVRAPMDRGRGDGAWVWTGIIVVLGAVAAAAFPGASGQGVGNAAQGRQLAETWCTGCHVVVPAQKRGASTSAPSFAAIARMKSTTQNSLRAFLQSPHAPMPDLQLTNGEIEDLSTYILTQRGG
jgi:mono/diheme cytochrome c family protein